MALQEPTKDNFLKMIQRHIDEYAELKKLTPEDFNDKCQGALDALKCLKQMASVLFSEKGTTPSD